LTLEEFEQSDRLVVHPYPIPYGDYGTGTKLKGK